MENIVVFDLGYQGWLCYLELSKYKELKMWGFADNAVNKQGNIIFGYPVKSMEQSDKLNKEVGVSVVIVSKAWAEIGIELEKRNIPIKSLWENGHLTKYNSPMTFEKLDLKRPIKLYAGDICDNIHFLDSNLYGLSINQWDHKHIRHDITEPYPLPDNCIDSFEAEDVLEHICFNKVKNTIDEIFRVLKRGALFRISVPDFWTPDIKKTLMCDVNGNILWDPSGGGKYGEEGVEEGAPMVSNL